MTKLFISHSSQDDTFVRNLRAALADHDQDAWIDSRELYYPIDKFKESLTNRRLGSINEQKCRDPIRRVHVWS